MKKKRKYIYLEKCLIIRILQIYIFSFYDFLFFISLSVSSYPFRFYANIDRRIPGYNMHFIGGLRSNWQQRIRTDENSD